MRTPPKITAVQQVAKTRLFEIEQVELSFSNGVRTNYERLAGKGGAVMIIGLTAPGPDCNIVLIREYAVGLEQYELGFPKGRIDPGEAADFAANRELTEEAGFAARQLEALGEITVAPAYASFRTHLFLATDLHAASAEGDEPEPPEVVLWPLADARALLERDDFSESRARLAVYMLLDRFEKSHNDS